MGVSVDELHLALQNSYNMNPVARHQAETFIQAAESTPGIVSSLYQVAINGHVALQIRQAAAIRMKRLVEPNDWNGQRTLVTPEEKVGIKQTILETVSTTPPQVHKQLLEVLRKAIEFDFPNHWPELVPSITEYLLSGDLSKMRGALSALRKLTKRYEYMGAGSERYKVESEHTCAAFIKPLLQLFQTLNGQSQVLTDDRAEFQKLLLKIFYSVCHNTVPPILRQDAATVQGWMTCIGQILTMPVSPGDMDGASASWRAKKWAGHILTHWLDKCGSKTVKDDFKPFAQHWLHEYAPHFVNAYLELAAGRVAGTVVPDKPLSRGLFFLHLALGQRNLYSIIQPRIDELLQQHVYNLLAFSAEDQELWVGNPQEYVRKIYCVDAVMEDFYNPRMTAVSLLCDACAASKSYHDKGVMVRFLNFLSGELQAALAAPADVGLARRKYGALGAIGALRRPATANATVAAQLEPLLVTHVFPGLTHPCGFLRANALWTVGRFARKIKWTGDGSNLRVALEANLNMLRDPEFPVRVQAGLSLKWLVANKHAEAVVKPLLGQIVSELFTLMDLMDVEELVTTLEMIVGIYGDDMIEHSAALCQQLCVHFLKITSNGTEDTDHDAVGAGATCLSVISTLLYSSKERPAAVRALQPVCLPLLIRLCHPDCSEYFTDAMELVAAFTNYCDRIEPSFWQLFGAMMESFRAYAHHTFPEKLLAPFDNFLTRDTVTFLTGNSQGVSYVMMMFEVCKTLLENMDLNDSEASVAPKLIASMLQHAKPHRPALDEALPSFFDVSMARLVHPQTSLRMKIHLCGVIFNGLWYNAPLTLQYLESKGATAQFFGGWRELVPKTRNTLNRKMVCLGLTSLLELNNSGQQLPAYFDAATLAGAVQLNLQLVLDNWVQMVKDDEEEDDTVSTDDEGETGFICSDDDDEEEGGGGGGSGVMGNLSAEMELKKLCDAAGAARGDDDDLDLDFDDLEEVETLVDETSEAVFFAEQLARLRAERPQIFEALASGLDPQQLDKLQDAHKYGEERAAHFRQQNQERVAGVPKSGA